MAISPKDLLALTPEDEAFVSQLEKLLDEKLAAQFEPGSGGSARINLGFLADSIKCRLTFKMKKELENRYTKVGWTVGFEGDFIIIAEPKPEPKVRIATPNAAPKAPVAPKAPPAPAGPIDDLLDQEDLPTNFPSDAEIMSEVLGKEGAGPRVPQDPGGHRPPIVNSPSRDDGDNPYSRRRLSSG